MRTRDHGPSIKDNETYDALRNDGASQEKAARIANANADESRSPSAKGGKASSCENWTRDDLYEHARELEVDGRSDMSKGELIKALRNS